LLGGFNLKGTVLLDLSFVTFDWQSFCLMKHGWENYRASKGKNGYVNGELSIASIAVYVDGKQMWHLVDTWTINFPDPRTTNPNHHIRMTGCYWHVGSFG
jgi:hypothetical protein